MSLKQIATLLPQSLFLQKEVNYINKRDELIKKAVLHINELRVGTPFESKVETAANLAKRINQNVFLAGKEKDSELEYILSEGRKNNNYWLLYKTLNNKK